VRVRATITQDIVVEAASEEEAAEKARGLFDSTVPETEERYTEEVLAIEEVHDENPAG
jgi:hypothetical protein